MSDKFEKLHTKNKEAFQGGGDKRVEAQHAKGKLTARERIQLLLDENSFEELGRLAHHHSTNFDLDKQKFLSDSVVTGYGSVDGRLVYVYAQDFTVLGGSLSEIHAKKICRIMDLAMQNGAPLIGLNDSGGARIQEGVVSLAGYSDIFYRNTKASGVVPQISAIMGPCAGGAVYSPALTDFILMVEQTSYMFVTGPNVVKTVTHEEVTAEELGGANTHASKSGVTHFTSNNDVNCLKQIKRLLSYIPQNWKERPEKLAFETMDESREKLEDIVPNNPNQPYDIKEVIQEIIDEGSFMEVQPLYAENIVIGFARIGGRSIGIVANQPSVMAGVLDTKSSKKGARFVRFCDSFNVPLLVLEDVPGFMPGTEQEWNGVINEGAKLLYALCEATVPKMTVITRKAYGGAYCVMNSKHIGADMNFAWPLAEIAVVGAKGATEIIFKKEIAASSEPAKTTKDLESKYADEFANPYNAASYGYIDEVILPRQTREKLIQAYAVFENKVVNLPNKKHGNIPL